MTADVLIAVLAILAGFALIVGWLVWEFVTAPLIPDPDEQLAAAALTPDAPLFTPAEELAIDDAAIAADVDQLLAELFPPIRPATPQEDS
ncbi:hypothetical protein [Micromonospora sediminicola]|uniref:hypothetical protein n=1 Tax=Micromonospora sediminicola TaxID=946078 RepID=UPI0037A5F1B9